MPASTLTKKVHAGSNVDEEGACRHHCCTRSMPASLLYTEHAGINSYAPPGHAGINSYAPPGHAGTTLRRGASSRHEEPAPLCAEVHLSVMKSRHHSAQRCYSRRRAGTTLRRVALPLRKETALLCAECSLPACHIPSLHACLPASLPVHRLSLGTPGTPLYTHHRVPVR